MGDLELIDEDRVIFRLDRLYHAHLAAKDALVAELRHRLEQAEQALTVAGRAETTREPDGLPPESDVWNNNALHALIARRNQLYDEQLAAKADQIAAQDELIAELRRWVESAEQQAGMVWQDQALAEPRALAPRPQQPQQMPLPHLQPAKDYAPPTPTIREAVRHKVTIERLTMLGAALEQRSLVLLWAVAALVAFLTFALRAIYLDRSFDITYDDIVYFRVSHNVAQTLQIYYDRGIPFYLHPPFFFYLEGIYLKILHPAGDIVHQVYAARFLNAAFAGLSATMLFLLGRRISGWCAGTLTALIFALDPYIIKINSHNLLETPAMLCILVGYSIILYSLDNPTSWLVILGAGGSFGLALLTKEQTAFVTLLLLGVCFLLNWGIPRRMAALTGTVATMIYSFYVLTIIAAGHWKDFESQKITGIYRFIGLLHQSGFTLSHGHRPSFANAVTTDITQFDTTYVWLGCGAIAVIFLFMQREPAYRLVAVWTASAYLVQAYSIKFGTNAEQYFYYLVVLAMLASVTAGALLLRSYQLNDYRGRWSRVDASLIMVFLVWSIGYASHVWVERHFTPDNETDYMISYIEHHIILRSRIDATPLALFAALRDSDFVLSSWSTPHGVMEHRVQYVVISTALVAKGYDAGTPELLTWLRHHTYRVVAFRGPTNGSLELYRIQSSPVRSAARATPTDRHRGAAARTPGRAPSAAPSVVAYPLALSFGAQAAHRGSAVQAVHIVNLGPTAVRVERIALTNTRDYAESNTCGGTAIVPYGGCTVYVRFAPTASGRHNARLVIADNAPTASDLAQEVFHVGPTGWRP